MSSVCLENVIKRYESKVIIDNLSLEIPENSFTVIVGPSGCGKTTTLRMIAGLEEYNSGVIKIGDQDMTAVAPQERDLALVFQNYALYPHMTVAQNIGFGLKNNKVSAADREIIIDQTLELVQMLDHKHKLPTELSGGQRQRVALARAISKKPQIFLMDEPLSNLDAKLRVNMRHELVELHKKLKSTFIYITHDQVEALSMADYIIILKDGVLMQAGSPDQVYNQPENQFVAQFIGDHGMNVIKIDGQKYGFRPHRVTLQSSPDCLEIDVELKSSELLGEHLLYHCVDAKNNLIKFIVSSRNQITDPTCRIYVKKQDVYRFNETGDRIYE